jgi:hypothetical protein
MPYLTYFCVDRPLKSASPLAANDHRGAVALRIRNLFAAAEVASNARAGGGSSAVISIVCAPAEADSEAAQMIAKRVMI